MESKRSEEKDSRKFNLRNIAKRVLGGVAAFLVAIGAVKSVAGYHRQEDKYNRGEE